MATWVELLPSERDEVMARWATQDTASAALALGAAQEAERLREALGFYAERCCAAGPRLARKRTPMREALSVSVLREAFRLGTQTERYSGGGWFRQRVRGLRWAWHEALYRLAVEGRGRDDVVATLADCDCRANDWTEGDNGAIRCVQCGGYTGEPGTSIRVVPVATSHAGPEAGRPRNHAEPGS
jgi:hypothetical protein